MAATTAAAEVALPGHVAPRCKSWRVALMKLAVTRISVSVRRVSRLRRCCGISNCKRRVKLFATTLPSAFTAATFSTPKDQRLDDDGDGAGGFEHVAESDEVEVVPCSPVDGKDVVGGAEIMSGDVVSQAWPVVIRNRQPGYTYWSMFQQPGAGKCD